MGKFGWSLPPGCTQQHIDEAFGASEESCEICGLDPCACDDLCKCSEPEDEGDGQCKLCGRAIEPEGGA